MYACAKKGRYNTLSCIRPALPINFYYSRSQERGVLWWYFTVHKCIITSLKRCDAWVIVLLQHTVNFYGVTNRDQIVTRLHSVMWVCLCIPRHIHCSCNTVMAIAMYTSTELVCCTIPICPFLIQRFRSTCPLFFHLLPAKCHSSYVPYFFTKAH